MSVLSKVLQCENEDSVSFNRDEIRELAAFIRKKNVHLVLDSRGRLRMISIDDIYYISVTNRKLTYVTADGVCMGLDTLEDCRDALHAYGFISFDKNNLVNVSRIRSVDPYLQNIYFDDQQRVSTTFSDSRGRGILAEMDLVDPMENINAVREKRKSYYFK